MSGLRILASLDGERVVGGDADVPVRCSIGTTSLAAHAHDLSEAATPLSPDYFAGVAEALIRAADAALYRAKGQGGGRLRGGEPVAWPTLPR
jgi:GGDEF domain-containing protein